ncbi:MULTISPECIES: ester cyclase [Parachlamydia]|jgi:predicted ester cyclase|uniref:Ester cyclase n=2 Tax=Parachlamydia acanthamoebae TaxID=83552 RepID=F8KVK1_PARAV|nr:ester cyclase [Parachlamydia acanthamoebae]EFB41235.1 hypothetical protein pah_c048o060 [Parachlamydia acanthamoebae str. Hall's coccus]CCB85070.1 putative uncharacterized protein [Parachlamydia acanthamoebae UV-7]
MDNLPHLKLIGEEFQERIWNKKDLSAIDDLLHPDAIIHSLLGNFQGRELMKNVVKTWLKAFPNLSVKNIFVVCERDVVVTNWRCSANHQGEFKNKKPTGRPISFSGVSMYRIKNDKIIEYWSYFDVQHILNQIG